MLNMIHQNLIQNQSNIVSLLPYFFFIVDGKKRCEIGTFFIWINSKKYQEEENNIFSVKETNKNGAMKILFFIIEMLHFPIIFQKC